MTLFGQRALVSGGSRGIGRAITLALAAAGADVVFSYRSNDAAAIVTRTEVERLGRAAHVVQSDMGSSTDPGDLCATAIDRLGGLDIVVCSAGMHTRSPFLDLTPSEWDIVIDTDLRGPFLLSQAAARHMVTQGTGGRIIMISSISADVAYPNLVHYQAAKAGLRMLARGMALELVGDRITVNVVAPGVVATDLSADTLNDPVQRERRVGRIPMGRPGAPEDIAAAVTFLASDATNWMTGSTMTVDGGQTIL